MSMKFQFCLMLLLFLLNGYWKIIILSLTVTSTLGNLVIWNFLPIDVNSSELLAQGNACSVLMPFSDFETLEFTGSETLDIKITFVQQDFGLLQIYQAIITIDESLPVFLKNTQIVL